MTFLSLEFVSLFSLLLLPYSVQTSIKYLISLLLLLMRNSLEVDWQSLTKGFYRIYSNTFIFSNPAQVDFVYPLSEIHKISYDTRDYSIN